MRTAQFPARQRGAALRMGGQRGAALLTAMLTVTLVASLSAATLWQQYRGVEIEAAERARSQAGWILNGALDWARLILREDARAGGPDTLSEPWAVPLQESRLSSFLAADRDNNADLDDSLNAFLSGQMADAQAKLNINNLIESGKPSEFQVQTFKRLFALLGLPEGAVDALTEGIRLAQVNSGPLRPLRIEQLGWLGLGDAELARLAPYVTLLPLRTAVNLNTASAEVIYAVIPSIEQAEARAIVEHRKQKPFRSLAEVGAFNPEIAQLLVDSLHSVNSSFFEVTGRLRLDDTVIQEISLVQRNGLEVRTMLRQRVSLSSGVDAAAASLQ